MTKEGRTIVKVDEDKVMRMIAGDDPVPQKEDKKGGTEIHTTESTVTRKRPAKTNYADIFLKTVRTNDKKQTTVQLSESVFDRMEILLKATKGLSMGLFINNVLIHHFEEYKEDIQEVRKKYISKLTNDV